MKILCKSCINYFLRKFVDFSQEQKKQNKCLILGKTIPESQKTIECTHYESEESDIANLN